MVYVSEIVDELNAKAKDQETDIAAKGGAQIMDRLTPQDLMDLSEQFKV